MIVLIQYSYLFILSISLKFPIYVVFQIIKRQRRKQCSTKCFHNSHIRLFCHNRRLGELQKPRRYNNWYRDNTPRSSPHHWSWQPTKIKGSFSLENIFVIVIIVSIKVRDLKRSLSEDDKRRLDKKEKRKREEKARAAHAAGSGTHCWHGTTGLGTMNL